MPFASQVQSGRTGNDMTQAERRIWARTIVDRTVRFRSRYPLTVEPLPPVLLETIELSLDEKLDPLDLLPLLELLADVQAEFKERTKGFTYKSPIPDIIKEPVLLPADMKKHESVLELKEAFLKQQHDEGFQHDRASRK
jgi:hypothetical protein